MNHLSKIGDVIVAKTESGSQFKSKDYMAIVSYVNRSTVKFSGIEILPLCYQQMIKNK